MTKKYSIYVYQCPKTFEYFYIGKDSTYGKRGKYWKYPHTTPNATSAVDRKLAKLQRWGLQPIIHRLLEFDECENAKELLYQAEIYWIQEGKKKSWPLLNHNNIFGFNKNNKCKEETKKKISQANKGKIRSQEAKRNYSISHKDKKASIETKQKMSNLRKGKKLSQHHKKALSEKWYNSPKRNKEMYKKISQSKIGKPRDEQTKEKISQALKGKPWTEARYYAQKLKTYKRLLQILQNYYNTKLL